MHQAIAGFNAVVHARLHSKASLTCATLQDGQQRYFCFLWRRSNYVKDLWWHSTSEIDSKRLADAYSTMSKALILTNQSRR